MHPKNLHNQPYDLEALQHSNPLLKPFVYVNQHGTTTIDFANPKGVLELNRAILAHYYKVPNWSIPEGYLCPPIPGRADYIHHLAELLSGTTTNPKKIKGLDVGVGANCIYPILAVQLYDWDMVGVDIDKNAIHSAQANVDHSEIFQKKISIIHQPNNAHIFEGAIQDDDYFHFTMCNPPFHRSEQEAQKGTFRKLKNLSGSEKYQLNFGGQANELWCNGGESLFIKRMVKQSVSFQSKVGWFTTLVSKKENLPKIYKQLDKLKCLHQTILMEQGAKKSRIVAWKF